LESLLNVRIIETDFDSGENEKVDVIALGSDNNPLFKTAQNESVAARAVFYLDWLVNNKNLFNKLVQKTLTA